MTMNYNGTPMNTPDDLRTIETAMDALGAAERASAPERLNQSVFLASFRNLSDSESAPLRIVTRSRFSLGLRVAAAVALIGAAVGLYILNNKTAPTGTSSGTLVASTNGLEDDINFLLDLRSSADELAILGERIDSLYLDAATVGDALKTEPASMLLGEGAL